MKTNTWKEDRKGNRTTKIVATWVDRMRRPGGVAILMSKVRPVLEHTLLIEGDVAEVNDTLNNIADIAWARGWRPAGLLSAIASSIDKHLRRTG